MYYCLNASISDFGVGDTPTAALENWEENSSERYEDYEPTEFTWIKGEQLCVEVKRTATIRGN